jgi:hypothetical protein
VLSEPQTPVKETRQRDFTAFTQSQQKPTNDTNGSTRGHRFAEVSLFPKREQPRKLSLAYTDIFRLWNLLYGRSFIEPNPPLRDPTIYFASASVVAQPITRKSKWELVPA